MTEKSKHANSNFKCTRYIQENVSIFYQKEWMLQLKNTVALRRQHFLGRKTEGISNQSWGRQWDLIMENERAFGSRLSKITKNKRIKGWR